MFNVPNNTKTLIASSLAGLCVLTASCDGGKKRYETDAAALVAEAQQALDARNYARAMQLLDSLDSGYSKAFDARRDGMHLRTIAEEGLTLAEISQADSMSVTWQLRGDSLARLMQRVGNDIEPYFVGPGQNVDVHGTTGLYARMMPDGTLYMVSALSGKKANHTSVTVSGNGVSATTATIAHDGEQNDRSSGTEIINYTGAECDTIARLIGAAPDATYTLTFNGSHSVSMPLPEAQKRAIAIMAQYLQSIKEYKRESFRKTTLEKRLTKIREQMARTYRDEEGDSTRSNH